MTDLGELPSNIVEKINAETNEVILSKWLRIAAKATSIEEFEFLIDKINEQ